MSARLRETCSCGAVLELEDDEFSPRTRDELMRNAAEWREGHRHEFRAEGPYYVGPYTPGTAT